jgi:hypothetical protein
MFYYYHWVDTSAGRLLVPEDIIRPVVNTSALACFITSTGSIHLLIDPVLVIKHASAEALTTGRMMSSGTNSPLAEVSTQC